VSHYRRADLVGAHALGERRRVLGIVQLGVDEGDIVLARRQDPLGVIRDVDGQDGVCPTFSAGSLTAERVREYGVPSVGRGVASRRHAPPQPGNKVLARLSILSYRRSSPVALATTVSPLGVVANVRKCIRDV